MLPKALITTSLSAGRMYVPFGSYESNMVSDPLTLDLGETSETAIMVGMESGNISGSLYTFSGDTDETSATDNDALSFGGNITYRTDTLWMGASYISNIADSDGIQDMLALRSQLCRIPRKKGSSGLQQIMSKAEMKKEGIDSPNESDSVMMSLFIPPIKVEWAPLQYRNNPGRI